MPKTPAQLATAITKRSYLWIYTLGIILLIASGWLWWTRVYLSPSNVFWGMLETSLSTRSVAIQTKQTSQQGTVSQDVQFELGSVNRARSLATVVQGSTKVKTELVGTPTETYSRYRSIQTDQKNAEGKSLDVSRVEGVWVKRAAASGAAQELFAQATIGVGLPLGSVPVPVGEVTPAQRAALLKLIKQQQVYETSFKDAIRSHSHGRLQYTYKVKIQTILYVRLMKTFAKDLGLTNLQDIDPNTYSGAEAISVQLTVDAKSRHLTAVSVAGSDYSQQYASYGVPVQVTIPKNVISNDELQKRLGEL